LQLDRNPYHVLSEGKLYWVQDAYTTSDHFPYSEPYTSQFGNRLNYIRNSVKVVVDVYEGSVRFYVMEPEEPVLGVYRQAFPGIFRNPGEPCSRAETAKSRPHHGLETGNSITMNTKDGSFP
jgi:uncharacterized membrane protein (UPF0182 family)